MPDVLSSCKKGDHKLETVLSDTVTFDTDHVVRWCSVCGSIVVDIEVDGRLMGYVMTLRSPYISKTGETT